MTTVDDLIVETQGMLRSWNLNAEQMTTLATSLTANATGASVASVSDTQSTVLGMSSGIVEIDEELIYVSDVSDAGAITIPPWGRGYNGTTPQAHSTGAKVTSQPAFPRAKVLSAINETVVRVFPKLYGVDTAEFTVDPFSIKYDLPDDAINVVDARWLSTADTDYWVGVRKMRMNQAGGDTTPFRNVTVDIADVMTPGQPLQITYSVRPTQFAAVTDDYASCGLPNSCKDLLVVGAAAILTVSQELSRLQLSSIEQQNRSQLVAPSAALTSSRFLEQRFQDRLKEEAASLREQWPVRIMGVWI